MTLTIDLSPEQDQRVRELATQVGVAPETFALEVVLAATQGKDVYAGLPHRTPDDLVALAREQGVAPLDVEALRNSGVWPEDESPDEFLETLRDWRREGA